MRPVFEMTEIVHLCTPDLASGVHRTEAPPLKHQGDRCAELKTSAAAFDAGAGTSVAMCAAAPGRRALLDQSMSARRPALEPIEQARRNTSDWRRTPMDHQDQQLEEESAQEARLDTTARPATSSDDGTAAASALTGAAVGGAGLGAAAATGAIGGIAGGPLGALAGAITGVALGSASGGALGAAAESAIGADDDRNDDDAASR
jgi:hypothetical protein